jgi:transcription antitermination factor NusG
MDKNNLWLVVYTKSNCEKKVAQKFFEMDIEYYLPLIKTESKWSDRIKTIYKPLISSVIFVKYIPNLKSLYLVKGVNYILQYKGSYAYVHPQEIENIKILIQNFYFSQDNETNIYKNGDNVEVIKGPLKGLIGTSIVTNRKHQLIISIQVLNTSYTVNIPKSFVKKI